MKRSLILTALFVLLFFLGLWRTASTRTKPQLGNVKLVLFIVADQFAYEYVDRFGPYAQAGLKRIFSQGYQFTDAHHDHGVTETCPGHASLVTGSDPRTHGLIGNGWYDRESKSDVYCIHDDSYGKSPRHLYVSGIADWIKDRSRSAKAYAVSAKDRSAIPLGGKNADAVFWFDKDSGVFTSSGYYRSSKANPPWLAEYSSHRYLDQYFGKLWRPVTGSEKIYNSAGIRYLDEGLFPDQFPHPIGESRMNPDKRFYESISATPFLDLYTTDFVKQLVAHEELGQGEHTDFLGISYSALDRVGHAYGPDSPEVFDTFLRLDRTIGDLLQYVDRRIGLHQTLVIFSSDHGVQHFPEATSSPEGKGYRQSALDVACFQGVNRVLFKRFQKMLFEANGYLDSSVLEQANIKRGEVTRLVKRYLSRCKMVEHVWDAQELNNCRGEKKESCLKYARSYLPERSPDYLVQPKAHHLSWLHRGTGHGTPYSYDSHVPLVFLHPELDLQRNGERISIVDAAPTVAKLVGLSSPPTIDGRPHNLLD